MSLKEEKLEMDRDGGGSCCTEKRKNERPYKGIRMRKWEKWVAQIREPNKRSRIWLGSYSTPVAAARAYDTAVYYLRGPPAQLNFPGADGEHRRKHEWQLLGKPCSRFRK